MLMPSQKIDGAEYINRKGEVFDPPADADFFERRGAFILCDVIDRILLVRPVDSEGFWELPGGGLDEGEDFADAALRETVEETGFDFTGAPLKKISAQHVHLYLHNEPCFWNYEQQYFLLTDEKYKHLVFDGIKDAPENGHIQWVEKNRLHEVPIKATVLKALVETGYLKEKR